MICSVPINRGFAYYFASSLPEHRFTTAKDSFAVPIENVTPHLPLDAIPLSTGTVAIGTICYCQSESQAQQIRRLPPIAPTIKAPPSLPTTPQQDISIMDTLLRGIVTAIIIKGLLQ